LYLLSEQGAGDDVIDVGEAVPAAAVEPPKVALAAADERALAGMTATEKAMAASSTASRVLDVIGAL
jgi:hypothetical protein